ncbi:M56 family metallopeptidase [Puia sp. P3]|uniref:M56 family metallopeptidase n=1 Tax=Puia sp. P3 TaxID=3423952 RepID=UPI003D6665A1
MLRRLTFYNLNRWYLLCYSFLCFFIPLVDVGPAVGAGDLVGVIRMIPVVAVAAPVRQAGWGIWDVVAAVLAAGAVVLLVRLLVRWLSLVWLRRRSRLLVEDGRIRVYRVEGAVRPFSFGRAVYLNPGLHTESELADIVMHEYVHIRQNHSVDILFAELLSVACWFNPFVWLIRHSIRQNLEFIADRQVLGSGVDRKAYQYHLLNVVGRPAYRIANSYNFSSLKKRIVMMNKSRSARLHLVKFLFVLPLLAVLLLAFRSTYARIRLVERPVVAEEAMKTEQVGEAVAVEKAVRHLATPAVVARRRVTGDTSRPGKDTVKLAAQPLYLMDGKEASTGEFKALAPADIYAVNVLKGEQALTLFGDRGKDGVVAITTKEFHNRHQGAMKDTLTYRVRPLLSAITERPGARPLYVVDGKEVSGIPNDVTPDMIESISVIKNEAAKAVYGDRGKNGVVIVVLKKISSYVPRMTIDAKEGPMSITADTIRTKLGEDHVVITAEKVPGQ